MGAGMTEARNHQFDADWLVDVLAKARRARVDCDRRGGPHAPGVTIDEIAK